MSFKNIYSNILKRNAECRSSKKRTASKLKAIILLLLIFISTIVTLPILNDSKAYARLVVEQETDTGGNAPQPKYSTSEMYTQIKSLLYYKAIASCMELGDDLNVALYGYGTYLSLSNASSIKSADANTGKWFSGDAGLISVGSYLKDSSLKDSEHGDLITKDDWDGKVNCDTPELMAEGLALWGITGTEVLCNSGFIRTTILLEQTIEQCISSTAYDFIVKPDANIATSFKDYIKNTIYSRAEPSIVQGAVWYLFYRHTLNESCIKGIDTLSTITLLADPTKNYSINWVDDVSGEITANSPFGGTLQNTKEVNIGPIYRDFLVGDAAQKETCEVIVSKLNSFANNYSSMITAVIQTDGENDTTPATGSTGDGAIETKPTCGDRVPGMGWVLCPIISGLATLNDSVWKLVQTQLKINPLDQSDAIYQAWGTVRDLANVVFVIIFLIMIFSQITSVGITNYGIKKLLPRLIVGAIVVNASFVVVQIAVDLSNIVGSGLYDLLVSAAPTVQPSWESLVELIAGITVTAAGGAAIAGTAIVLTGGAAAAFWALLPMAAMGALGLLAAILTLIFRQAIIPVLAILAPLAFVAYLLPNTESLFKKWRDLFIKMLMLYPLAALIFGGSQFAAGVIIAGNEKNWWMVLIGLIMLTLPLFSLPFIASKGGAITDAVGKSLKGLAEKARKPLTEFSNDRKDFASSRYLANVDKEGNQRKDRNGDPYMSRGRNMYQRSQMRKKSRELYTKTNQENFSSQWANNDMGKAPIDYSERAKQQTEIDKTNAGIRLHESTAGQKLVDENRRTSDVLQTRKEQSGTRYARPGVDGELGIGEKTMIDLGLAKKQTAIDTNRINTTMDNTDQGKTLNEEINKGNLRATYDSEMTNNRVMTDTTAGGGRDLNKQVIGAKKANELQSTKIGTEFSQTAEGTAIGQEIGIAKKEARTEENKIATDVEKLATPQTILNEKLSEENLKAAQAENTTKANKAAAGTVDEAAAGIEAYGVNAADARDYATKFHEARQKFNAETDRTNLATTTIGTDYARSAEGEELKTAIGVAKMEGQTEETKIANRVEKMAPKEVILGKKVAEAELKTSQAANTTMATNAAAGTIDEAAARLVNKGVASPADARDIATRLHNAQRSSDIEAGATNAASNMIKQELYSDLAKGGPVTTAYAGIDEKGVPRAQAYGISQEEQLRNANVTAAASLFTHDGYKTGMKTKRTATTPGVPDELLDVALGNQTRTGLPPTQEQQIAAIGMSVKTGDFASVVAISDKIATMPAGPERTLLQQTLQNAIQSGPKKWKGVSGEYLGLLQSGGKIQPYDTYIEKYAKSEKLLPMGYVEIESDELERMDEIFDSAKISSIATETNGPYALARLKTTMFNALNDTKTGSQISTNKVTSMLNMLGRLGTDAADINRFKKTYLDQDRS